MARGRERAWSFTRRDGEVRLWARAGRWSLWIDTGLGRCELNGAALADLPARREDPLADGARPPEIVEASPALDPDRRRIHGRVLDLLRSGGGGRAFPASWSVLAVLAAFLAPALLQRSPGWILFLPALGWTVLGARLRGAKALAFAALTLLAGAAVHPWTAFGAAAVMALNAAMGAGTLGRALAAALVLGMLQGPGANGEALVRGAALLATALLAGGWSLKARRVALGLPGAARWQAHVMAEALAAVDSATLWCLDPQEEAALPPLAARVRELPWRLDGAVAVREVSGGGARWIFLPETLWVLRDGGGSLALPLADCRVEEVACRWEAAPPGLGGDQWIVRVIHPAGPRLVLLFGEADAGRRFAERFRAWTGSAPAEAGAPQIRAEEALLGVRPGASLAEVKAAYHRAVRRWHPDAHPGATAEERRALEARLRALTEAYAALEAAIRNSSSAGC